MDTDFFIGVYRTHEDIPQSEIIINRSESDFQVNVNRNGSIEEFYSRIDEIGEQTNSYQFSDYTISGTTNRYGFAPQTEDGSRMTFFELKLTVENG